MELKQLRRGLPAVILSSVISIAAHAQSNPRYIRFAGVPSAVKGALFTPARRKNRPMWRFWSCTVRQTFSTPWLALSCPSAVSWFSA